MPNKLILISWVDDSISISASTVYNSLIVYITGSEQDKYKGLKVIDLDTELDVSAYNIPFHSIQVTEATRGYKDHIKIIKLWNRIIEGKTVFFEIHQKNGRNQFMVATINYTSAEEPKKEFRLPLIHKIEFIDRFVTGRKLIRKIKKHINIEKREKRLEMDLDDITHLEMNHPFGRDSSSIGGGEKDAK